ncbi:MAG: mechanosensitive ion channel family protein [Puniceicoccales bacterium]|nr:mechanosensitive ion channel family protein [Puniceicoccales bacterium]
MMTTTLLLGQASTDETTPPAETPQEETVQTAGHVAPESLEYAKQTLVSLEARLSDSWGLGDDLAKATIVVLGSIGLLALALIANWIVRVALVRAIEAISKNSSKNWIAVFKETKVFTRISFFASALVFTRLGHFVYSTTPGVNNFVVLLVRIYVLLVIMGILDALLNASHEILRRRNIANNLPIRGIVQAVKLVIFCLGMILILSILLKQNPAQILAGIGALMVALMFAFKDPIMGLVGGIMLSLNRMVLVGDWIEMPKFGADGDVVDVTLTTVKVRNWDMTYVTIPTYALISDSFKNWRGMSESGGRRIKRTINIDMQTIRFADADMLDRWEKIKLLTSYIQEKEKELNEANSKLEDASVLANSRLLTNVGTFRAYCLAYLEAHPKVHQNMTLIVRQLQPDEYGLPLELYFFTNDTGWVAYEGIQSDIFDHLLAIIGEFGLSVYQRPSSTDQRQFTKAILDSQKN